MLSNWLFWALMAANPVNAYKVFEHLQANEIPHTFCAGNLIISKS